MAALAHTLTAELVRRGQHPPMRGVHGIALVILLPFAALAAGCRGQCPISPPPDACPPLAGPGAMPREVLPSRRITPDLGIAEVDPWTISVETRPESERTSPDRRERSLLVGAVLLGLNAAKEKLDAIVQNLTGELKALGESYQKNVQIVISDLNKMFEDRLDQAVTELNALELRIVEDAELLIRQTHAAAANLAEGALDQAKLTIREGGITAYDVSALIPGRNHEPRLVYLSPERLRANSPSRTLTVRGNFLTNCQGPVLLDGQSVEVKSANANEYVVLVPDALFPTTQAERTVTLTAAPSACETSKRRIDGRKYRYVRRNPQSLSVTLLPLIEYNVEVTLRPEGQVPVSSSWPLIAYDHEKDCNANKDVSRNFCVPKDWTIDKKNGYTYTVTSANCGSRVNSVQQTNERCVYVDARVKGCGKNWLLNCKGHGWLGYKLTVNASTLEARVFPPQSWDHNSKDLDKQSFMFTYNKKLPAGATKIKWKYDIVIKVKEGPLVHAAEFSEVNPNGQVANWTVKTVVVDGRLSLEIAGSPPG